jgi:hypothetical protein
MNECFVIEAAFFTLWCVGITVSGPPPIVSSGEQEEAVDKGMAELDRDDDEEEDLLDKCRSSRGTMNAFQSASRTICVAGIRGEIRSASFLTGNIMFGVSDFDDASGGMALRAKLPQEASARDAASTNEND